MHQLPHFYAAVARGTPAPGRALTLTRRTLGWLWQPAAYHRLVVTTSRPPQQHRALICSKCRKREGARREDAREGRGAGGRAAAREGAKGRAGGEGGGGGGGGGGGAGAGGGGGGGGGGGLGEEAEGAAAGADGDGAP